jgi:hypothetical protein
MQPANKPANQTPGDQPTDRPPTHLCIHLPARLSHSAIDHYLFHKKSANGLDFNRLAPEGDI